MAQPSLRGFLADWDACALRMGAVEPAGDSRTGRFCHGDTPSLADLCLYAQVWNNRRFDIATTEWPTIADIFERLDAIPAFNRAAPPNQPDAC